MNAWKKGLIPFLAGLLAVMIPVRAQEIPGSGPKAGLPSVDNILERSIRAAGGREAWMMLTSLHMTADFSAGQSNMSGTMEIYAKAPDKESDCLKLTLGIFQCRAYDGQNGWKDDSKDGLKPLEGKELQEMRRAADFYSVLNHKKHFSQLKVKGEDDFDGQKVYVLEGVREDGQKQELYFSKESGLHVGSKDIGDPDGDAKTTYLEDYKEVVGLGVKLPSIMRLVSAKMALRMMLHEIAPNVDIPDAMFVKPDKSARDAKGVGKDDRPDNGRVVDGIYTNDFFAFKYIIPKGWMVHGEETQKALMETGKELVAGDDPSMKSLVEAGSKRAIQLLSVFEFPLGTPEKENRGIQIMASNVVYAPGIKTGGDYQQLVSSFLKRSQVKMTDEGEPVKRQIGGFDFFCQKRNLTVGAMLVNESSCTAIARGYALSFIFSAKGKKQLEEVEASIETLAALPGRSKP